MAETSSIEWTDATWNPITGCSVVSPGCTNCYAMRLAGTRLKHHPSRAGLTVESKAGPVWNGQVRLNEGWLDQPFAWGKPRMIFVNAHGDTFHESVPDAWIDQIFARMAISYQHVYQVLTKRSSRMRAYLNDPGVGARVWKLALELVRSRGRWDGREDWPLTNVWVGVSAEDQPRWDERVGDLVETMAAVRWVSAEPLLGPIADDGKLYLIHWLVAGGENGPRPTHPDWIRRLRDDCSEAETAFFFKQWGSFAPIEALSPGFTANGFTQWLPGSPEGAPAFVYRVGKRVAGRLLDGVTYDAMPVAHA